MNSAIFFYPMTLLQFATCGVRPKIEKTTQKYRPKPTNFCPLNDCALTDQACKKCVHKPIGLVKTLEERLLCCIKYASNGQSCEPESEELCDNYAQWCSCWCNCPGLHWKGDWAPGVKREPVTVRTLWLGWSRSSSWFEPERKYVDDNSRDHCLKSCTALREEYLKQNYQHGYGNE